MYGLLTDDEIDIAKLTSSIMAHEGLRLHPYTDTTGHITIGYGRDLSDDGITPSEASELLSHDIQSAILQAKEEPWWPHIANNDARCRALIEIVFNIGIGGIRGFVDAIACLCNDDFAGAASNFMDSKWASQVGNRARVLTKMIATGQDA